MFALPAHLLLLLQRKSQLNSDRSVNLPAPLSSLPEHDPVFDAFDRVENDYHRFRNRAPAHR